ncbi:MAG TPA: imidazolonepropionase [Rhodothermales bacterium]|nr:imidazolonepropionase [Rhodothermales bacterium]
MPVLHNIGMLATCAAPGGQAVIHEITDAALAWEDETIRWVGPVAEIPDDFAEMDRVDAGGALVVPGLIDCHTHLAFGGWRADEFEQRLRGASYLDIARRGGGIASTMKHTRAMSKDDLLTRANGFLREMARLGVTTVEAKSGYGLSLEDELKTLRVYQRLREKQPLGLVATFLGAHVVPPEYKGDHEGYIRLLCDDLIPQIAQENLASFCDVFVEDTAFSVEEARRIFEVAKRYGLRPKLHADQLSDGGGARLAAEVEAASADHLEYSSDDGIAAMAEAGVVAVSLPLATLYLNQKPMEARRFIEAGVPVAVATDFNPGSAPSYHLPLAMMLACTMQRMTPAEVLKGATLYAARALGLDDRVGSLEPGMQADFVLLDAPSINHWLYHFRPNAAVATYVQGKQILHEG